MTENAKGPPGPPKGYKGPPGPPKTGPSKTADKKPSLKRERKEKGNPK